MPEGSIAENKKKHFLYLMQWLQIAKVNKEKLGSKYNTFQWVGYWGMEIGVLFNIK